ncbi:MAG TPA: hypothetical protein PKA27_02025 [Fimbriimonadaceae bacterium]|nr:hypothetical protein [Fimbriimonadaceae bacterium]
MTAALALVFLTQDLIGDVTKAEFLNLVRSAGFQVTDSTWQHGASISDGKASAQLRIWYFENAGGLTAVRDVSGTNEFELPKTLSQEDLAKWQKSSNLESLGLRTYLGGRVVVQAYLATQNTSRASLKRVIGDYLAGVKLVGDFVATRGGKPATTEGTIGSAPLNLNDRLTVVDSRDFDYLRVTLKWGEAVDAGGGKGWMTGGQPFGVPVIFNGFIGRTGFDLIWMGQVKDEAKRERIRELTKDWHYSLIQDPFVNLSERVETDKGITVGQIIDKVEKFARKIKDLGL